MVERHTDEGVPDLARLAAEQVVGYLSRVRIGSPLPIESTSDLCSILELLVPTILRREHPEWATESIDGFFFSSTIKSGECSAELAGTCILITDQTVTPFRLTVAMADSGSFESFRVRLGEAGTGPLGDRLGSPDPS